MPASILSRFLTPWRFRRQQERERLTSLRQRDGDNCARCRKPIRFDKPAGHEQGARIEILRPGDDGESFANLCLTHGRCNVQGRDQTDEVMDRLRPAREADLFIKARTKRAA